MRSVHPVILLGLLALSRAAPEVSSDIEISTPRGRILGRHVDYGNNSSDFLWGSADIFLGIPYVKPPVDDLRFAKPVPLCQYTSDDSVYNAQEYKPACLQDGNCGGVSQSEDCLHVNVFTPNATSQYKYPVMLWIHGGSLMTGCAAEFPYSGAVANLVNRGVVVVVIQYRLSLLGFFTDGSDDFPPNLGMLDQVEAIRWTRDQIAYFGGDPYRITLFGQSAGAASASAHTYSPLSQDLFQQVITQSGVVLTCFEGSLGYDSLSEKRAFEVCKVTPEQFHSGNYTDRLKRCFADKDPKEWLKYDTIDIVGWKMQQDNYFFPDIPNRLAKFRHNIPVMVGSMQDEWTDFDMGMLADGLVTFENYTRQFFSDEFAYIGRFLEPRYNDTKNILMDAYAGVNVSDDDHEVWLRANSGIFTSGAFTSLIQRDFSDYLVNGNDKMWLYIMTYPKAICRQYDLPGWPDAVFHTAELPYLWHIEANFNSSLAIGYATQEDFDLSAWFGEKWTNFAKFGTPDPTNNWPNLPMTGREVYMDIHSAHPTVNTQSGYMSKDITIWNEVFVALLGDFHPPQFDGTVGITKEEFDTIKYNYQMNTVCEEPDPSLSPPNSPTVAPPATTKSANGDSEPTTQDPADPDATTQDPPDTTTSASMVSNMNVLLFAILFASPYLARL